MFEHIPSFRRSEYYKSIALILYLSCNSTSGLRIDQDVTKDQFRALAALSTYRYACMDIEMSGSAGGIKIYPKDFSQDEYKSIIEKYSAELARMNLCGMKVIR